MKDAYLQFNGNARFNMQSKEFFSSLQNSNIIPIQDYQEHMYILFH